MSTSFLSTAVVMLALAVAPTANGWAAPAFGPEVEPSAGERFCILPEGGTRETCATIEFDDDGYELCLYVEGSSSERCMNFYDLDEAGPPEPDRAEPSNCLDSPCRRPTLSEL